MFIDAFLTIDTIGKQPKGSLMLERIKKDLTHAHNGTLFGHKKGGYPVIGDNMDGLLEHLSEISQRNTSTGWYPICNQFENVNFFLLVLQFRASLRD